MPKCCPCQKKGRCISCACVKAGIRCSDCWPSTAGQCRNQQLSDDLDSQSLSVASSLPSHSSPPCVSSSSGEVNLINTFNIANRAPQVPMTLLPANYHWGDLDGSSLEQTINAASEVVVHWRQNTFLVPNVKGGCQFVRELARLYGGMTIRRHNDIRDLTGKWLKEVCHDVECDPHLQSLSGEQIHPNSANLNDDTRTDIRARGFWRRGHCAFFDVRVFHPNAQSYRSSKIETLYRRHENLKKREYGDRIREVENGSFTPLVFATTGGLSRETTIFYKRLAELMSISRNAKYHETISWMRRKLSFPLVKSAIMCIRGSRSIKANYNDNITLGLTESHPV